MSYNFEIDKIVDYLKPFKTQLADLYTWNVKIDKLVHLGVLNIEEVNSLNLLKPYDREVILKEKINITLHQIKDSDKETFDKLCLWIIKEWGGIKTSKDEDTLQLISTFLSSDSPNYKRISSTSKIGSYLHPEKYIIYDSRVAYSLNWIILSQNAGNIFFPIPNGRNSKMSTFDMNVLIRLKNISHYQSNNIKKIINQKYINQIDKNLYIPKKESYLELNKLITQVHHKLWEADKKNKLFYTEMLLFSIADKKVFKDITEKLSLIIE